MLMLKNQSHLGLEERSERQHAPAQYRVAVDTWLEFTGQEDLLVWVMLRKDVLLFLTWISLGTCTYICSNQHVREYLFRTRSGDERLGLECTLKTYPGDHIHCDTNM